MKEGLPVIFGRIIIINLPFPSLPFIGVGAKCNAFDPYTERMQLRFIIGLIAACIIGTNAGKTCQKIRLKSRQDFQSIYEQVEQPIWPEFWNDDTTTIETVILESPDLAPLNLTVTEEYGYCPGTTKGSPKIRCQWDNVAPAFYSWTKISLALSGKPPSTNEISLPLVLTAYRKDPATGEMKVTGRKVHEHKWFVRTAPTYEQTDKSVFPQPRKFNVSALPKTEDERKRLKQWFTWADFHPTGFYLNPNTNATISVSGLVDPSAELVALVGTPALVNAEFVDEELPSSLRQSEPLRPGNNIIRNPFGGILYIRYASPHWEKLPLVSIELADSPALQPIPHFKQNQTADSQWIAMLKATKVPYGEHVGDRVILTGVAESARKYAEMGQSQVELLQVHTLIIGAQDDISGLNGNTGPINKPSPLRPMVSHTRRGANPNSSSFRAAIPFTLYQHMGDISQVKKSWMMWHEFGHHRQHVYTWSWNDMSEVTVNIYSLAARRLVPEIPSEQTEHSTIEEWEAAKTYLAQDISKKDFDSAGHFTRLVMFEQLRVIFGSKFYHELHTISRLTPDIKEDKDRKHFFQVQAAKLAGENLGGYFITWGLKPEPRTLAAMTALPTPAEEYTKRPVYGGK